MNGGLGIVADFIRLVRTCNVQFGVGYAVCHAAYQAMMTGCDMTAATCGAGCYAGSLYTVEDGCPCDR